MDKASLVHDPHNLEEFGANFKTLYLAIRLPIFVLSPLDEFPDMFHYQDFVTHFFLISFFLLTKADYAREDKLVHLAHSLVFVCQS